MTENANSDEASSDPISDEVAAMAAQMWIASLPWYTKAWMAVRGIFSR